MYRFYFKLKDKQGCIVQIKDIVEKNSTIAYRTIKTKFIGLKPELTARKEVLVKN